MRRSICTLLGLAALLCACAPTAPEPVAPAPVPSGAVPLGDAIAGMEPQAVWQHFYELTQIPRPSGYQDKVRDFMVQFGQGLGLETVVDGVGNVIIRRPAAPGMEGRKGVVLQAHMDMVAVKAPSSTHDFMTDPIEAYVEEGWVRAKGTTLGADNGIGMAIAMAVLETETPTGPLEVLVTVDEETTMAGANGLEAGILHGDYLINLDNEVEGNFVIGSAGGVTARVSADYGEVETPPGLEGYLVTVGGMTGGHSGMDINRGRGHAIQQLARFLRDAAAAYPLHVVALAGGSAPNAIPTEATALVGVPAAESAALLTHVETFAAILQQELAGVEPGVSVTAVATELPTSVMEEGAQGSLIRALDGSPQGVMRMSNAVPGLVETSLNLGILDVKEGQIETVSYLRSAVDSALDDVAGRLASVWQLAGFDVEFSDRYAGWAPDPNASLLQLMRQVYTDLYGVEPSVGAVHAGLECGTIRTVYPNMEAISIGPTMMNVHSPNEQLEVASVEKALALVIETLNRIPE